MGGAGENYHKDRFADVHLPGTLQNESLFALCHLRLELLLVRGDSDVTLSCHRIQN